MAEVTLGSVCVESDSGTDSVPAEDGATRLSPDAPLSVWEEAIGASGWEVIRVARSVGALAPGVLKTVLQLCRALGAAPSRTVVVELSGESDFVKIEPVVVLLQDWGYRITRAVGPVLMLEQESDVRLRNFKFTVVNVPLQGMSDATKAVLLEVLCLAGVRAAGVGTGHVCLNMRGLTHPLTAPLGRLLSAPAACAPADEWAIPSVLHQVWIGPFQRRCPWKLLATTRERLAPEMAYEMWDDARVEREFPGDKLRGRWYYDRAPHLAAKADIVRYNVLYRYGGLYLDMDQLATEGLSVRRCVASPTTTLQAGYHYAHDFKLIPEARDQDGNHQMPMVDCCPYRFQTHARGELPVPDGDARLPETVEYYSHGRRARDHIHDTLLQIGTIAAAPGHPVIDDVLRRIEALEADGEDALEDAAAWVVSGPAQFSCSFWAAKDSDMALWPALSWLAPHNSRHLIDKSERHRVYSTWIDAACRLPDRMHAFEEDDTDE